MEEAWVQSPCPSPAAGTSHPLASAVLTALTSEDAASVLSPLGPLALHSVITLCLLLASRPQPGGNCSPQVLGQQTETQRSSHM